MRLALDVAFLLAIAAVAYLIFTGRTTTEELKRLRAEAERTEHITDSLVTAAAKAQYMADSVQTALDSTERRHSRVVDSLETSRAQLQYERMRATANVDSLVEQRGSVLLGLAIQTERDQWRRELLTLDEIIEDERVLQDQLRASIEAERAAKMAERGARIAAEHEADRWRALADEAEEQVRRSRIVAVGSIALGVVIAILGVAN